MEKIKYLFKRILKLDYSNMIKIAKAVSKKTNMYWTQKVGQYKLGY